MGRNCESGIIIAKIGTDTLVRKGKIDAEYTLHVADQIGRVRESGRNVVLVTSGAGALGGQRPLTEAWERALGNNGIPSAEILFREESYDGQITQVKEVLKNGIVPVVNGDAEKYLGDRTKNNDFLAAGIAVEIGGPTAFLTAVEGVLDAERNVIPLLPREQEIINFGRTDHGTGGIQEKIRAARLVADEGHKALIAHGRREDVIWHFANGRNGFGTRIAA